MEDNIDEEVTVKINFYNVTYYINGIRKFKDTNININGIYEDEDGSIHYFKNGKLHNENGPSIITTNGFEAYYINGKYHRIDGPAAIYSGGYHEWYINGHYIDNETMDKWLIENDISLDWNIWTDSDKMLFALHWSDYKG